MKRQTVFPDFRTSCNVGAAMGTALCDYILANFLLPMAEEDESEAE